MDPIAPGEDAAGVTRQRRVGGPEASRLRAVPLARRLADLGVPDSDAVLAPADDAVERVAAVLPTRRALDEHLLVAGPVVAADARALRARHAAQRGVRFAALAQGAEDLRGAAARVRARHRALADEAGTLWERWSGPSAEEVADRVVSLGRAAQEIVTLLEETAETVEGAGLAVADDITTRADAARALAADLPDPPDGTDRAAARRWAGDLDARLRRYLEVADRTDEAIATTWRELAERIGVLRRLSAHGPAGSVPAASDGQAEAPQPGDLPADLLALPEILAALGPLIGPNPGESQTVDDSR